MLLACSKNFSFAHSRDLGLKPFSFVWIQVRKVQIPEKFTWIFHQFWMNCEINSKFPFSKNVSFSIVYKKLCQKKWEKCFKHRTFSLYIGMKTWHTSPNPILWSTLIYHPNDDYYTNYYIVWVAETHQCHWQRHYCCVGSCARAPKHNGLYMFLLSFVLMYVHISSIIHLTKFCVENVKKTSNECQWFQSINSK